MGDQDRQLRKSILENPWYWVYVFCTAGLVALVVMGPKFASRQTQLEQNMQGRDRAAQETFGEGATAPVSSEGNTAVTLAPLYVLLGVAFVVAWIMLWRNHFRGKGRRPSASAPSEPLEGAR